jgi:putative hydrolase of the HAD superfamily
MGKYEAVIFDLGGTLINQSTWEEQDNYIRRMAETLGLPFDGFHRLWRATYEERTKGSFGSVENDIKYICQQLHISAEKSRIEVAANIPYEITKRMIMSLKEGAVEVILELKSQGLKTGLVCNWSHHLPLVWKDCPLAPLIDIAVFSSSEGVMKPDQRIFLLATARLAVQPEKCLYIADGMDEELSGAIKVGMKAVMVRYPDLIDNNPYREEWDGTVISSLKEVLSLVI